MLATCCLLEYGDNHSILYEVLWQYCTNKPNNNIINSKSFKLK